MAQPQARDHDRDPDQALARLREPLNTSLQGLRALDKGQKQTFIRPQLVGAISRDAGFAKRMTSEAPSIARSICLVDLVAVIVVHLLLLIRWLFGSKERRPDACHKQNRVRHSFRQSKQRISGANTFSHPAVGRACNRVFHVTRW